MNKIDLQNLLFNVRHGYTSVDHATLLLEHAIEPAQKPIPEPKKEPWELYPDYESCMKNNEGGYSMTLDGVVVKSYFKNPFYKILHTEKLAKRQLAELQLAKIADKWGEGIEEHLYYVWFPGFIDEHLFPEDVNRISDYFKMLPFRFKTQEQCKKSIELHQQLWKDWFMID